MVLASLELGARQGLRAAKADCTGQASLVANKKAGMQEVYKLAYDQYKINGEIVFKNAACSENYLTVVASRLQKYPPYVLPIHAASKM